MAFTPFDAALGTRQGRLEPAGFEPTSGDFAFVLGSDVPGHEHDFEIGDFAEVQQAVDLTSENFIRARKASMVAAAGRTRDRADMAANVSKLSGVHTVGLRLELVGV